MPRVKAEKILKEGFAAVKHRSYAIRASSEDVAGDQASPQGRAGNKAAQLDAEQWARVWDALLTVGEV